MNNSGALHLKSGDFLESNHNYFDLLIRISGNKLSYALLENSNKKLAVLFETVMYQSPEHTLDQLLEQNTYLQHSFNSVKLSVDTVNFSFIPSDLDTPETLSRYRNFIYTSRPSVFVRHYDKTFNLQIIANISEEPLNAVRKHFPTVQPFSQVSGFLGYASRLGTAARTMLIQFNAGNFEVGVFENSSLLFYNRYDCLTVDDFHYQLLVIIKELELQDELTSVFLSGEIENYSEYFRRLSKYFRKISFTNDLLNVVDHENFKIVPAHQFPGLFSLDLCE